MNENWTRKLSWIFLLLNAGKYILRMRDCEVMQVFCAVFFLRSWPAAASPTRSEAWHGSSCAGRTTRYKKIKKIKHWYRKIDLRFPVPMFYFFYFFLYLVVRPAQELPCHASEWVGDAAACQLLRRNTARKTCIASQSRVRKIYFPAFKIAAKIFNWVFAFRSYHMTFSFRFLLSPWAAFVTLIRAKYFFACVVSRHNQIFFWCESPSP